MNALATRIASIGLFAALALAGGGAAHAAAGTRLCFQCHDPKDFRARHVHVPVAQGRCQACHNPHVARYEGLVQEKDAELCYRCHAKERAAFAEGVVHEPVRKGRCLACHDPHDSDAPGLRKGKGPEACFGCHKALPRKFPHTHAPYAKGDCQACHLPHAGPDARLLKGDAERLCYRCHKGKAVWKRHRGFPGKAGRCLSCHNPHGSSRAALVRDVLHPPYAKGCRSCHGKGAARGPDLCLSCHPGVKEEVLRLHSHLAGGGEYGCTACHSPHAGDGKALLRGAEKFVCRKCHEGSFRDAEQRLYVHPDLADCTACHAAHGSDQVAMLKKDGTESCTGCHETQGKFTHPVGEKARDPRTGQALTCVSCHDAMGTDFKYHLKQSGEKDLCLPCHPAY
ncbi:hypothetical protein G3N55_01475 [Dissulfurirhabdus thermomarina]|uniref:Doubled CXXCH motif domain-containing protein n=1 Tax=Dissulfurirhabdus thermomarina TaxID=1765737 RepID=A0A6N9TP54_DISTH|nr:cytochrome c3 family protein [Dissulfurirhabdus thermomarina]NDY41524.1 hypothetical protein [Dissulfurirhabdus thermomarina]NMX22957.1 hypothetical protein [Dissulfurirhabdus thermomarina]